MTITAYSIFDDFGEESSEIIRAAGIELTVHPLGKPRPDAAQMRSLLQTYDCIIIGTSQKISEDMFDGIESPRIIATASVGVDHIRIPEEKKQLVMVINTPKANAQSVAEYTMACALSCCKRLVEGNALFAEGKNNKSLFNKPGDLFGKTIGVVGAGNISVRIMDFAQFFGMTVKCWTRSPEKHSVLADKGVEFTALETLCAEADFISVNLPNNAGTKGLISEELIDSMKEDAVFISVSRAETVNIPALLRKAAAHPSFYVCMDVDVTAELTALVQPQHASNVLFTPHIAGGTIETRKRMFHEIAVSLAGLPN